MDIEMKETETTIALIRHFDEIAFNAHDVDAMMADMTEDAVCETIGGPYAGRGEGQAAGRALWEALFAAFPDGRLETDDMFACGNRCSYSWTLRWTKDDGTVGEIHGTDIYTVRDGKIAYKKTYLPPFA